MDPLTKEAIKANQYLRQKVRQRINRIRNEPNKSQDAVKAYDQWAEIYNKKGTWSKQTPRQQKFLEQELKRIDRMYTSRAVNARKVETRKKEIFGKKYEELDTKAQTNLWEEFNRLKDTMGYGLDSDQIKELYSLKEEYNQLDFKVVENKLGNTEVHFYIKGRKLDRRTKLAKQAESAIASHDFKAIGDTLHNALKGI